MDHATLPIDFALTQIELSNISYDRDGEFVATLERYRATGYLVIHELPNCWLFMFLKFPANSPVAAEYRKVRSSYNGQMRQYVRDLGLVKPIFDVDFNSLRVRVFHPEDVAFQCPEEVCFETGRAFIWRSFMKTMPCGVWSRGKKVTERYLGPAAIAYDSDGDIIEWRFREDNDTYGPGSGPTTLTFNNVHDTVTLAPNGLHRTIKAAKATWRWRGRFEYSENPIHHRADGPAIITLNDVDVRYHNGKMISRKYGGHMVEWIIGGKTRSAMEIMKFAERLRTPLSPVAIDHPATKSDMLIMGLLQTYG